MGAILLIAAAFLLSAPFRSAADGFPLASNVTALFAPVEQAREILSRNDDFTSALSALDRSSRVPAGTQVSNSDLLAFAAAAAQEWTADETNKLTAALHAVQTHLAKWNLPLPRQIVLIKTSGREEFDMFYTRQNAIIFPAPQLRLPARAFTHILLHELFHVLSRHDAALRAELYGIIGFTRINEVALPEELLRRKVTNPDGAQHGWRIRLSQDQENFDAIPLLLAQESKFNPAGRNPLDFFHLLVVTQNGTNWIAAVTNGQPRLLSPDNVHGWTEQIGLNTGYIIHPDEILAENFAQWIMDATNGPTPRIYQEMERIFRDRNARH